MHDNWRVISPDMFCCTLILLSRHIPLERYESNGCQEELQNAVALTEEKKLLCDPVWITSVAFLCRRRRSTVPLPGEFPRGIAVEVPICDFGRIAMLPTSLEHLTLIFIKRKLVIAVRGWHI